MIHVIDDWYIEPDELNWQSFQYKEYETKTGEKSMRKVGVNYHWDLEMATKRIMNDCKKRSLAKKECELTEAIADLRALEADAAAKIAKAIKSIGKGKRNG